MINDHPGYRFEIGKGTVVREGKDVTIVATGICVDSALGAAKMLEEEGISAEVVNICTIKPLDEEIILISAKKTSLADWEVQSATACVHITLYQ